MVVNGVILWGVGRTSTPEQVAAVGAEGPNTSRASCNDTKRNPSPLCHWSSNLEVTMNANAVFDRSWESRLSLKSKSSVGISIIR
jgi:hypothetical protein